MVRIKVLITVVMAFGLTLGLAGMASAATITCGQCHGAYINNTDGTTSVMAGVAGTEDLKTPQAGDICNQNGRGLHGIHMNYSSVTYGQWSRYSNTHAATRGTCDYCHNKHSHENGFVEFSGVSVSTPTQSPVSAGLRVTGTGITANGLDITQMDGTASCTTACHKGTSDTNPAQWGNYTSASIKLSCSSCHMDSTNINTISTTDGVTINGYVAGYTLSSPPHVATAYDPAKLKGHATHLNGEWSDVKIVFGGYTGTLKSGLYACQLCHPDNSGQGRASADNGTQKAYPHATDGTNVVATNAVINGAANILLNDPVHPYNSTTAANGKFGCTNICHANYNNTTYGIAVAGKGTLTWDDTGASHCDSCHNHTATSAVNNVSNVKLTYAHSLHFDQIQAMMGRAATCNDCHVATHSSNYAGKAGITQLPVLAGAAGLAPTVGWSKTGVLALDGTCSNSCHIKVSPAWNSIATGVVTGVSGCSACHEYPGSSSDWDMVAKVNGHTVRAKFLQNATTAVSRKALQHLNNASAYSYLTDTYSGVTGDANLCGKCHSGAMHINSTIDIAASNGLGTSCNTNFTFNNITSGRVVTCGNASCHFGKTTPNWW